MSDIYLSEQQIKEILAENFDDAEPSDVEIQVSGPDPYYGSYSICAVIKDK